VKSYAVLIDSDFLLSAIKTDRTKQTIFSPQQPDLIMFVFIDAVVQPRTYSTQIRHSHHTRARAGTEVVWLFNYLGLSKGRSLFWYYKSIIVSLRAPSDWMEMSSPYTMIGRLHVFAHRCGTEFHSDLFSLDFLICFCEKRESTHKRNCVYIFWYEFWWWRGFTSPVYIFLI